MTAQTHPEADPRDLVLTRVIEASPHALYRCWTEPALVTQWFAPRPYTTPRAEMDVRPGGATLVVMQGPDGVEMPNPGVYLEVEPNRKLVMTDAYTEAWKPAEKPFMTTILTFEDLGDGRTRYTAVARHWTLEDKAAHEKMGFHEGWGICTDQLVDLARTL
jgi:uncharacterized protein YndB with AHSA1/START domain